MKYTSGKDENIIQRIKLIKGIIFDCDGVLIDSRASNIMYYNLIKRSLGLSPMNKEEEEYVHTHTVFESVKFIVPEDRFEEALKISKEIPYEEVLKLIKLEEGLRDFLDLLKRKNIKCAVNTNRTTTMDMILDKFGLKNYFFPVVTANILKHPKPHPESVEFILRTWKLGPHDVVYIGDSVVDAETAKNSGVEFWAYKNPDLNGNLHINCYRFLYRLFLNH